MNEVVASPFAGMNVPAHPESSGSRQLQARENTETLAMVAMAKRFPRDVIGNTDRILNAFTRTTLAERAAYQFSKGGTDVTGPSIRAAEAIAQMWGNLSFGFREISRGISPDGVGFSEVEAFCWDMESGNRQPLQFIVRHWRDTRGGGYAIKDERDIYELIANQAQRRKRACILALVPGDVIEAAMNQVDVTLRTTADTSPENMTKMVEEFGKFGVTKEQIEKRIQRRLDAIQPAQVVTLKRIYASLRDDMSSPEDWFEFEEGAAATPKPASKSALKPYPADKFETNLAGWHKVISEGRKTADQIIAHIKTLNTLTEDQEKRIRASKASAASKPASDAPTVTAAQVLEKMDASKTIDELDAAASLIGALQEIERGPLNKRYDELHAKFTPQE